MRANRAACSAADPLRLEPMAQRGRKRRPGLLEPPELLDAIPVQAAQLRLDGRQIDAGGVSLTHDRSAADPDG